MSSVSKRRVYRHTIYVGFTLYMCVAPFQDPELPLRPTPTLQVVKPEAAARRLSVPAFRYLGESSAPQLNAQVKTDISLGAL